MKALLIGVLVGLLQGALSDRQHGFIPAQRIPVVVRVPFGDAPPYIQHYYRPVAIPQQVQHPRARPQNLHPRPQIYQNDQIEDVPPFYKGHVQANAPYHFQDTIALLKDAWRPKEESSFLPLRDAVEYVPIEGQMTNLLKSVFTEEEVKPFSRGHVEAFPVVQPEPDIYPTVYSPYVSSQETPLIGIRDSVESPPRSPNVDPFFQYRDPTESVYSNLWSPYDPEEFRPMVRKGWSQPVPAQRSNGKKVVCYYESWSAARKKPMNFDIKDIDPFKCTHLIYSFAGLDSSDNSIISLDRERDVIQGAYKGAVALKAVNPNLKVMIAIGGWAEGGKTYSDMVSSERNRTAFIDSVVAFMKEHHFDGLDLDWEYPGATDRGGKFTDKDNFAILTEQLYGIFKTNGWILSMAVPVAAPRIQSGYDLPRLAKALDFFNLMVYDLRGPWDGVADHHAPLRKKMTDKYLHRGLNLKEAVQLFLDHGVMRDMLIVGLPFYGRSFTLENKDEYMPGSRVMGPGDAGRYTESKGYMAYYEICMEHRNGGWNVMTDEAGGKYMVKGYQWIGYDDPDYIAAKVQYIKNANLGGVMMWAIDIDDYLGVCGSKWPLMTSLWTALESQEMPDKDTSVVVVGTEDPTTRGTTEASPPVGVDEEDQMKPMPEIPDLQPSKPTKTLGPKDGDACTRSARIVRKQFTCNRYLECVHGVYRERGCAAGLEFDERSQQCDWPENANCKETKRPQQGTGPQPETPTPDGMQPSQPVAPGVSHPNVVLEPAPAAGPLSGDYMVVCYFTNWAWYRRGLGKYTPDNIDENICTHVVYGFAVLDYSNLIIKPHDTWADFDNKFYKKVTDLKSKGIKVSLAIGGWNDSQGDKYSRLVNSPAARARFIEHVLVFLQEHNFDGLDLDWEYPKCWQVECKKGPDSDKPAFAAFVEELSRAFKPRGLLLSAAVSPSKKIINLGYDVPALNRTLDWIAVMTYDFHGHWDKKTGHVAPMFAHPEDDYDYFNMDYAIRYWIEKGADKKKIVLGMPLYGQSFTLDNPQNNGLNAPAGQKGIAGEFTKAAGFLAYYEICENIINKGWTVVRDPKGRMGPYAYRGNQWVGFDDVATIRKKSKYIREMGLGGGMVWALDLDDFQNRCGQGANPLMKTIQSVLGPASTPPAITDAGGTKVKPGQETMPETQPETDTMPKPYPEPQQPQLPQPDITLVPKPVTDSDMSEKPKVVCYYTNWSWYRQGEGKFAPEDVEAGLCTHINYGFVVLDADTFTLKPHDTWIDIDNKFYERVVAMKKGGQVKVLVALGGWNDSKGPKYSQLANDPARRKKFNDHALSFIQHFGFDGLDLDWEYPKCWQVECGKGPDSDRHAFSEWIMELRMLFDPHKLLLTAAVSPSYKVVPLAYDVPILSQYLDFINVMTYDYFGHWDKKTGHVAPLYDHPMSGDSKFNVDSTIDLWISLGAEPKKLVLGMPLYGQSFTLVSSAQNGLKQESYGGGEAGPYTRARGFLAYYEICYFIKHKSWTVVRDPNQRMGPYAYRGNQWVGFDDIPQIRLKAEYVRQKGLGGAMIWALDLDDFKNRCDCETHPLLKTINRVLRPSTELGAGPNCPLLGGGQLAKPVEITGVKKPRPQPPLPKPQPAPLPFPQPAPHPVPVPAPFPIPQPAPLPVPQPAPFPIPQPAPLPIPQPLPLPPLPVPQPQPGGSMDVGHEGAKCSEGQFMRHSDCSKFYECFMGKLREVSCYRGLHWNGMGRCVLPQNTNCVSNKIIRPPTIEIDPETLPDVVARPAGPVQPVQPVQPTPSLPSGVNDVGEQDMPCQGGEFKRHKRCDKFYECLHGQLKERTCFPGLQWDGKGRCTWAREAACTPIPGPISGPTLPDIDQFPIKDSTTPRPTTTTTPRRKKITPTTPDSTTVSQWYIPWAPSTIPTTPKRQKITPTTPESTTVSQWYVPWTPSTVPTTPRPTHPPGSLEIKGPKVVCYFTNWAWYRRGIAKYKPDDIDPDLCTHILYGFAVLDGNTLTIKPHDSWADLDNKFYERVTSFKARGIRVLVAIGGWNDSKGPKYSRLVNDPAARRKFTSHVVEFIEKYNFDGLDLDWEYPKCWQVHCEKGPASDKDGFSAWMKDLSEAFRDRNWLLTAAISPSADVIKHAYHVRDLMKYLDFVNVMTYDYHGHWDKQTGHVAPMYHHPDSINEKFNANYTIHHLISLGANRKQLIMGMPLYGQSFTLRKVNEAGLNSDARKGQAGEFTRAAGFLAYYEICDRVVNGGFSVVRDPSNAIGPYAHRGNQWVGFDDVSMIRFKSEYIKRMGLGGGMVWALDLDDFNNRCGCEPHPLLRTINRVLRGYKTPPPGGDIESCRLG